MGLIKYLDEFSALFWNNFEGVGVPVIIGFIFGGYYLFGILPYKLKKKSRNLKVEVILALPGLVWVNTAVKN